MEKNIWFCWIVLVYIGRQDKEINENIFFFFFFFPPRDYSVFSNVFISAQWFSATEHKNSSCIVKLNGKVAESCILDMYPCWWEMVGCRFYKDSCSKKISSKVILNKDVLRMVREMPCLSILEEQVKTYLPGKCCCQVAAVTSDILIFLW